jgi:hypothetical protein
MIGNLRATRRYRRTAPTRLLSEHTHHDLHGLHQQAALATELTSGCALANGMQPYSAGSCQGSWPGSTSVEVCRGGGSDAGSHPLPIPGSSRPTPQRRHHRETTQSTKDRGDDSREVVLAFRVAADAAHTRSTDAAKCEQKLTKLNAEPAGSNALLETNTRSSSNLPEVPTATRWTEIPVAVALVVCFRPIPLL